MQRLILFLLLFTSALISAYVFNFPYSVLFPHLTFGSFISPQSEPEVTQEDFRVLFTGDIMLARDVERTIDAYGSAYPFLALTDLFTQHDGVVINFEASVPAIHEHTPDFTFSFSVDALHLSGLADAHITHASLANNHSFDYLQSGYRNTQDELLNNNIQPFGEPYNLGSSSVTYIEKNNQKIAVIGIDATLTDVTPEHVEALFAEVEKKSDFQIAYVHWGTEYALKHSPAQERLAIVLIDEGADVIIGHHPHVVQDIGIYKNVLIFYSLGNLVFDQYFSREVQEGLIISFEYGDGKAIELIPVSSIETRNQPHIMPEHETRHFLEVLAERSDPLLSDQILSGSIRF